MDLKEKLKQRIDRLPEEKLNDVSRFIESLEKENNKTKVLSFAGSWSDMDDDTFNELINVINRRKNSRTRFFDDTSID